MFQSASQKVIPMDGEDVEVRPDIETDKIFLAPMDDNPVPPMIEEPVSSQEKELDQAYLKFLLKQVAINRRYARMQEMMSYNYLKETMKWFLESATLDLSFSFEDLTLMMTLFVLFGDDIKIMCSPAEYDGSFDVAYTVCLFVFMFEFAAMTWSKTLFSQFRPYPKWTGYFGSFFWWLDLVAILSLFPDVPIIGGPIGVSGISDDASSGANNYEKAGRVVRLVRLVRLIKVYKVTSERRRRQKLEEELAELVRMGAVEESEVAKQRGLYNQRQSRLGDQLSESTTRAVIVLVLIVLIILPLLLFSKPNRGPEFGMTMLHSFNVATDVSAEAKQVVLDTFNSKLTDIYNGRYVTYLSATPMGTQNPYVIFPSYLDSLRDNQRAYETRITVQDGVTYATKAIFSLQALSRDQALFSILTTIFVAFILVGGALVFAADAEVLVIAPIKRMMNMVEAVAADPLAPLHFQHGSKDANGEYEMRLLETTIEKITGLLRVGFGEAGANIISANLSSKDSSTAINPLLPGVRMYAIFGFCDIHHFEDINRKLGNDVLKFVNCIAEIVHSNVHSWSGQCNKNLGNAFVIVWRIGDENTLAAKTRGAAAGGKARGSSVGASASHFSLGAGDSAGSGGMFAAAHQAQASALPLIRKRSASQDSDDSSNGSSVDLAAIAAAAEQEASKRRAVNIDLRRVPGVDILADHALIGYCKIIAEINRNKYVMRYRNEPRLTGKGKHDFKVRMGFGLHAGWAIEGAVGSLQKVDATYLSPHVNMAARLETSSKQYGVPLLASQDFYDLMSKEGQSLMRRLDVVTVKGSEVPIGIYTYDAFQDQPFKEDVRKHRPSQQDSNVVLVNAAQAALSSKQPTLGPSLAGSHKVSPSGSGNSTPQRRHSLSLLPGADRPAVFLTPQDLSGDVFEQDYDMLTLRKPAADPEFQEIFKEGVAAYLAGDWPAAKGHFERADLFMKEACPVLGGDGPSRTLLAYMGNQNFEAPKTWKGYRPLTSK